MALTKNQQLALDDFNTVISMDGAPEYLKDNARKERDTVLEKSKLDDIRQGIDDNLNTDDHDQRIKDCTILIYAEHTEPRIRYWAMNARATAYYKRGDDGDAERGIEDSTAVIESRLPVKEQ